jgi:VWFA-related protein
MIRAVWFVLFSFWAFASAAAQDVVFRSDVSLIRVDAQVVDRANRAITGLQMEDFVLREEGQEQQIRNFSTEETPVDIVFLLDVSGSMRTHVERIAAASERALRVLGDDDRVAVMVFDRSTRVRMPFRRAGDGVQQGLYSVINQETFDGGTDITRAIYEASNFIAREARRDARRAIVILTDDQTERGGDVKGVSRALTRADAVLSLLLAPDAMPGRQTPTVGWPTTRDPLGDIIFGRRGPLGRRSPGPVILGSQTNSAGTAEIARGSGGDTFNVDEASALENTLTRIRQRYALHFYLPEGVHPGQERNIEVDLSAAGRRRYPDAEVRYRRVYMTPGGSMETPVETSEPAVITQGPEPGSQPPARPQGGWRRADEPAQDEQPTQSEGQQRKGGWRRLEPGEEP